MKDEKEDDIVRVNAASSLGDIGDSQAVDALLAALRHKNSSMRFMAAQALGAIGDRMSRVSHVF